MPRILTNFLLIFLITFYSKVMIRCFAFWPGDQTSTHDFFRKEEIAMQSHTAIVACLILTMLVLTPNAQSQTSILNLDDDPITYPNNDQTNLRMWGFSVGPGVGCDALTGCHATGSMSDTAYYSTDGSSLQMNLNRITGDSCTSECYSDIFFFDRIYQNDSTASNANSFTLDMYATMDSVGNSSSQGLEYTIEQDVPSDRQSGMWDRYIYSWQCDFKNTGLWRLWDGAQNSGNGAWVSAVTTSGQNVPCVGFTPAGSFAHFYFHFQRLPNSHQIEYLDFTIVGTGTSYFQFNQVAGIESPVNWQTGLVTALQLDGDYYLDLYSAWADQWTVAYQ